MLKQKRSVLLVLALLMCLVLPRARAEAPQSSTIDPSTKVVVKSKSNSSNPAKWIITAAFGGLVVGVLATMYRAQIENAFKRMKDEVTAKLNSRNSAETTQTIKPDEKSDKKTDTK